MSILDRIGTALADAIIPRVVATIAEELDRRLPALTAALVTAITEVLSHVAVSQVDKITDAIPGTLDDAILDPIVARALEIFRHFTGAAR